MDYMQEDPYSSHRLPPHHQHDPYYNGNGGGGAGGSAGGGGYHDNSYAGNNSFDRHSEQSFQHRPPASSYSDLPNGGVAPMYNGPPDAHHMQHQPSRDDSYAGSYQGDPSLPHSNSGGNYMDPYAAPTSQYNGEPDDHHPHHQGYPDGDYSQDGHPHSNYSYQGEPPQQQQQHYPSDNPMYGNDDPHHQGYDDPHHHPDQDQYPRPEDYREIHNRSTGAVDEPPYFHDPANNSFQQQPNNGSFHHDPNSSYPPPQQQGYDPYQGEPDDLDRYSDAPRSRHSMDHPHDPRDPRDPQDHPHHQGYLPPVLQDPFADSPFHDQSGAHQLAEDPYGRGPSPGAGLEEDPYSRQSYGDPQAPHHHPGSINHGGGPPYDDGGGGGVGGPPYDDHHHPYPPQGDMPDGYRPPSHQGGGYPEDYPDTGSNYGSNYGGPTNNYPREAAPGQPYLDDPNNYPPVEQDVMQRLDKMSLFSPPPGMDGRVTPGGDDPAASISSYLGSRQPDLQQVIDFLSSPDDNVKASAVAYLQHLTYGDDPIKAKTRAMGGIPALIALLSHENMSIHKTACGALQNLSYGRTNNDNKRAVKNENGIPELIRLLRKTNDEDVLESVTGVLWNLSSCEDLKQAIIEDGLSVLVTSVLSRYAGYGSDANPWTTVCRNTTGIIRNVSSAGYDARKQLRECKGLVNTLIHILKQAVRDDRNDVDNKPVENSVCILRNLSYRIQEVVEPDFYKRRTLPRQDTLGRKNDKGEVGCFGSKSKPKQTRNILPKSNSSAGGSPPVLPPLSIEYRSLWGSEIHSIYSALLRRCTNPITMEAAAGAIQNLTACDWQPAVDSRMMMRKEKGLPLMVDLLSAESDRVLCATATALRNLAIDEKNRDLIGRFATRQLASRLPRDNRINMPDDTICAITATLYEVVKDNQHFALLLVKENGLPPLMHINTSDRRYLARTLKFTLTLLKTMWTYKPLHAEYAKLKYYQGDFTTSTAHPRQEGSHPPDLSQQTPTSSSNHTTPYNTLSRPISGGQGYDDNTLSNKAYHQHQHQQHHHQQMQQQQQQHQPPSYTPVQPSSLQSTPHLGGGGSFYSRDPRLTPTPTAGGFRDLNRSNVSIHDHDDGNYSRGGRNQPEEIHMNDFSGGGYAPLDEPQPFHPNSKPPVGGVPLFPHLNNTPSGGSGAPSPYPGDGHNSGGMEPLYAQVNKGSRRRLDHQYSHEGRSSPGGGVGHHSIDNGGNDGGVDSWV